MSGVESIRKAFSSIYDDNMWVYGSGPGSWPEYTVEYRAFIERFIIANKIETVTDLGCGDWQFSRYLPWKNVKYTGLDIVESVISRNNALFSSENANFQIFQSLDDLPGGDLLLSKEVLQHLPSSVIIEYIRAIRSKYKFSLLTNAIVPIDYVNTDIEAGQCRPLRLEQAPFCVPGAIVFNYFPRVGETIMENVVYLVLGNEG